MTYGFLLPDYMSEFSQNPQIGVPSLLEVGMAETVSCEIPRVFPAQEAVFRMFLEDQELSPSSSWKGDAAWASATVRAMETGDQELTCLVSLGPMEKKSRKPVLVYSKRPTSLLLGSQLGRVFTVLCCGFG